MVDDMEIEGLVTGGRHGWPFGACVEDLAELGYVEEEYFVAGMAPTYALALDSAYTRDGRWRAEQSQAVPFRTRIVVRRPVDPSRFNGTVVVEWNNVSMAHDLMLTDITGLAAAGFAFVGVSAQPLGIRGFATGGTSLIGWDEDRYGSLDVPSENASYGVFGQVAEAVGPLRPPSSVDPMGALPVERLIATGASQSAQRPHTYINAVHPVAPVFDGFLPVVHIGIAAPLNAP
jgi:Alpha/beta hydrolase domain